MKLDEARLLDALTMSACGRKPFCELRSETQCEVRNMARAFCVELARQAEVNERGIGSGRCVYSNELRAAFLPPKREPDVAAAMSFLRDLLNAPNWATSARYDLIIRALRALGVEEDA